MSDKVINNVYESNGSFLRKYKELAVGDASFLFLIWYELLTTFIGPIPGAIGLGLRSLFYPSLFGKVGRGVVFGRSITIRNPRQIEMGDKVILDDYCVLDAKGQEKPALVIGSRVFVSRNVILGCKNGSIRIGDDVTVGPNCTFHAVDASHITLGDFTIVAGHCYFAGGANYTFNDPDTPIVQQPWQEGRGIRIGKDVWIGGHTTLLDGANIGEGSVIGAQSLVKACLEARSIAYGSPAKAHGTRGAT